MTSTAVYTKSPQAVLDYSINWADVKPDGVTIALSTWAISDDVTEISTAINGDVTTIVLSGGSAGGEYTAVNTVTYNNGQIDQRTITIKVSKRRKTFVKRAGASLDYWIDWSSAKPAGLTVDSSVWTPDSGLTNESDGIITADDLTYIVISGGAADTVYEALNVITYSDGVKKDARIIELKVI